MNKIYKNYKIVFGVLFLILTACNSGDDKKAKTDDPKPNPTPVAPVSSDPVFNEIDESFYAQDTEADEIKIGSYNVHNFFNWTHEHPDFFNGVGQDDSNMVNDLAYLPENDPLFQSAAFIAKYEAPGKNVYCDSLGGFYGEQCHSIDWTESQARLKAAQLGKAIAKMGSLPDILAIQEVEGATDDEVYADQNHVPAIKLLQDELGYDGYSITHGMDRRPIQVGVLYKGDKLVKLAELEISATETYIKTRIQNPQRRAKLEEDFEKIKEKFGSKPTRNILNVLFLVKGTNKLISVYANHWPSQGAETDKRFFMAELLKATIDEQYENLDVNADINNLHTVLLGDYNLLAEEKYNPADEEMLLKGSPIHNMLQDPKCDTLLGADHPSCLQDVHDHLIGISKKRSVIPGLPGDLYNKILPKFPNGTYWYSRHNEYNRLDRIIMSRNAFRSIDSYKRGRDYVDGDAIKLLPRSFRIVAPKSLMHVEETKTYGATPTNNFFGGVKLWAPFGGDPTKTNPDEAGFSDHLGVYVILKVYK